jgi:hypothetical protein
MEGMGEAGVPAAPPGRQLVLDELERILRSSAFRGTRRSQDFLRYVVVHALDGRTDFLKERNIGAEVFQRPADYATGDDSIVRVKASEVRKRLAQFYREVPAGEVQIDLPAGSYVPEFRWSAPAAGARARPRRARRWLVGALLLAAAAVAGMAISRWRSLSAEAQFWRPVFGSPRPVLLCVAHPIVYHLSGKSRDALAAQEPPASFPSSDLVRDPDHYVGVGDALALARLNAFFTQAGKTAQVRIGTDTSFTDLRNFPAVLIGAYTNQWTMQVTSDLRYVFDRSSSAIFVRDQMNPAQRWAFRSHAPATDYAIISRIFRSRTGELVIAAAGLSHYGTQVAGEFLTNAGLLEAALRDAPPDWPRRNLQIVLEAEVIGQTPGPPKVVARWFW